MDDVEKIDVDLITPHTIEGGIPFRKCGCYDNREEAINNYCIGGLRDAPLPRGRPAASRFRGVGAAPSRPAASTALHPDGSPGPTPAWALSSELPVASLAPVRHTRPRVVGSFRGVVWKRQIPETENTSVVARGWGQRDSSQCQWGRVFPFQGG